MNELISIIVPIYKVEKYLHRCVDSILNQIYKNLEIILVDDGSPDNCGSICDEYKTKDYRIKVIHKKNGGLSDARNAGLELVNGDYICFLDSDDWIHEEYISKLYHLLIKTNSDISVCNFIRTSTENILINNFNEEIYEFSNVEALGQFIDKLYVQMVVSWGKLYKKKLFNNIRFPVGRIHEDEFITYKLIYKANKIVFSTAQLLYYWQRNESIMGVGFNIKYRLDALDALEERAEFLLEVGLDDISSKTYKSVFFIYLEILAKLNALEINKSEFMYRFKYSRNNLRRFKQDLNFKIFYELYFIAPKIMHIVHKNIWKINE
ncbi:MAG: glycosyltransferase family 2 protein [Eubacteriales bacterium]